MKKLQLCISVCVSILFVACSSIASQSSTVSTKTPLSQDSAVVSGSLKNGMSYFILQNTEPANRIYLRLIVRAGSTLEDDDQKGIAHLVEHMAFNGTTHFEKNQLVDYFESIGMAFGPEVNASTGFDETIYKLEIPADDPEILQKSLTVLQDWIHGITFDQTELDKERGVVTEEWRLGRGASGRVQDREIPFLFKGSRYAERLPIGDMDIVKNVSRDRVAAFYQKWYRPELMSVVVVGDMNPAEMQSKLEAAFSSIPASKHAEKRTWYPIPPQKKPAVLIVRDPEIMYPTVQLLEQQKAPGMKTVGDLRNQIIQYITYSILNKRLNEKTTVSDPLMLATQAGQMRLVKSAFFNYIAMVPATDKFVPAFKQLMEEMMRFEEYGVTDSELEREKQTVLDNAKQEWLNRDKIESATRSNLLIQSILYDGTMLSSQDQYDLYQELVPGITIKDIALAIDNWYTDRGMLLMVTAPEKQGDIPSEDDLLSLWQKWEPETKITAYTEDNLDRPLFDSSTLIPGSVVKEEVISTDGIKQWTLSNGARVVLYPTNFKANEIILSAWSKGGTSVVSDEEYPSLAFASSYAAMSGLNGFSQVDLQKKLAGKHVSAGLWVTESYEGVWGSSSVEDLETLFQLINMQFTHLYFSDEGWNSLYAQAQTVSSSRQKDPGAMFADLKTRLLYGNNIRRSTLTPEFVADLNKDVAEKTCRQRYADAGDFTFVCVGNFDEKVLRQYAETYLAGLPTAEKSEEARVIDIQPPKGISFDALKMGVDPKSRVFIAFGGKPDIGKNERELFDALRSLLDIRLREVIREDMSGSYGIQVNGDFNMYPAPSFELALEFGCKPGREDELSSAVFDQIKWLQDAPIPDSYITKLRETWRRNREEGLKTNQFWLDQIISRMQDGRSLDEITLTDEVLSQITPEKMQAMAKKYLDTNNYVKAYLEPADTTAQ